MGLEPHSRKGTPALAGLRRALGTWIAGKTSTSSKGFPKQAIWEAPEALRQPQCVAARMRG